MAERMVVIGTSLGGLNALATVLAGLPDDFSLPIAIAQHRTKEPDSTLATLLQRQTSLPVIDAEDKMNIEGGHIYLAPPDYHLLVGREQFSLSKDELVSHARPSIDVLFDSAASSFGRGTIAIVLTGANADGADGAAVVKSRGGHIVVQDPRGAESPIMPAAVVKRALADVVLPLQDIAAYLARWATVARAAR